MESIIRGAFSKTCFLIVLLWTSLIHPLPALAGGDLTSLAPVVQASFTDPLPSLAGDGSTCVAPVARFSAGDVINYRIENFSGQFPPAMERDILAAAFQTWANIIDIRFQEVSSGEHFVVKWEPWGASSSSKAGFSDVFNQLVFNASIPWSDEGLTLNDLFSTAAHEAGHVLGFSHSEGPRDIMFGPCDASSGSGGYVISKRFIRQTDFEQARLLYPLRPDKGSVRNGITAGDFNGDGIEDVGLLRNSDGNLFAFSWLLENHNWVLDERASHWQPGSKSQWVAAVAANLNGWGGAEFVGLRNYDGGLYAYFVDQSGFSLLASNQTLGGKSNWINLVAGNFDADKADELIALRGLDNGLYMFDYDGTPTLRLLASYVDTRSGSPWLDVVAGNFDNDAQSEIIVARSEGLYMYEYDWGSGLRLVASNTNPVVKSSRITVSSGTTYDSSSFSSGTWKFLAAGDLDGDGRDEVVALHGQTGELYVYKWDGSSTLRLIALSKSSEQVQDWRDLAVGDFNWDGVDEIMLLREGGLRMFKLQGSELRLVASVSHSAGHKWTGMTRSYRQFGPPCVTLISDFDGNLHLYCFKSETNTIEWTALGS